MEESLGVQVATGQHWKRQPLSLYIISQAIGPKKFDFNSCEVYVDAQGMEKSHPNELFWANFSSTLERVDMSTLQTAQDFMRRKLITLDPQTSVLDGVTRLLRTNISGAPVVSEDGEYLGVFSEKCSMNALTTTVELADRVGMHVPRAREFMTCNLTTLTPNVDVFEAVDHILSKRISGAPVVDGDGNFLGIFSEKTAMRVLIAAAYDQLPGTFVGAYMNQDRNRIIDEDTSLLEVAHKFQQTPYRRLPILSKDFLAGQISRRDVLRAELRLAKEVVDKSERGYLDSPLCDELTSADVGSFMDRNAKTTHPSEDLLSIAQVFLNTPYRRLPVVEDGALVGQVSRRDLLESAAALLRPKARKLRAETLYLSPLSESPPPSLS